MSPRLTVELVRSPARLAELEAPLWDLFSRTPAASPFQSPGWLLPWSVHLSTSDSLRALLVHSSAGIVGLLPLVVLDEGDARIARLMGHGVSDYLDAVVDPAHAREVLDCLWNALKALSCEVDSFEFTDLRADSALLSHPDLASQAPESSAVCPRLRLASAFDRQLLALPSWLLRNLKQAEARLLRRGSVTFRTADSESLPELLERFFELHTARWRLRGQSGVLEGAAIRAFHRDAAPRLLARGVLDLHLLSVEGQPAACALVLTRRDACLYLTGFDPTWSQLNPGTLMIGRAIARAIQCGRVHFDFLRGSEPYKYAWGARDTPTHRVSFPAATIFQPGEECPD